MGKDEFNSIEDFLTYDNYICFVFEQTSSLKKYWDSFFKNHPEKKSLAQEARQILLNESDVPGIGFAEKEELKERILSTIKNIEVK